MSENILNKSTSVNFDPDESIRTLRHYLPNQAPVKEFIHHNTLHAFQDMKFYEGIFRASKIFGYQTTLQLEDYRELYRRGRIGEATLKRIVTVRKGEAALEKTLEKVLSHDYDTVNEPRTGVLRAKWKSVYKIDLDGLVHPTLFRVLCGYLDQGISITKFPGGKGFLDSLKTLEQNSFNSFFKTKRARALLVSDAWNMEALLDLVVGDPAYYHQYLIDQQFSHHGWSGIVSTVETEPHTLLDRRNISLKELIVFELLLEIDALTVKLGKNWTPLAKKISEKPTDVMAPVPSTELSEVLMLWQDAFEWSYFDEVLSGISAAAGKKKEDNAGKSFQAMFCIDERECSIRRNLEKSDPACETFGTPGFFGVEFYFQPEGGHFFTKLAPAPVSPGYLIREFDLRKKRKHELLYTRLAHTYFAGFLISLSLGFWAGLKIFLDLFRPKMSPAISDAFAHMYDECELTIENEELSHRQDNLQIGFTVEEMAQRVEGVLRSIGLVKDFAALVYVVGHGSSSANNPHHSAHDCGACSGKPGSVNARVFAHMANHAEVRALLATRGVVIGQTTQFVGALHDTAGDQIAFYDERVLSEESKALHLKNKAAFECGLDLNAKERSRRFASISTKGSIRHVREEIRKRSLSMFEPRPELGHGTNSLCIVGGRYLTKGIFLDRRAFLNSYDYRSDPDGRLLTGIMRPVGPVCGGISLEYYFSSIDNHKLGAGTKVPHNVMGLIGLANGSDGDLRPGLPLQMVEVHDPMRLLVIVEHFPAIVLKVIQSSPEVYEWYVNEWIHIIALDPETRQYHYFSEGEFRPYSPLPRKTGHVGDFIRFIESAKEMETNKITDSTLENLPVSLIN
jgi:uncharacterized protein